MFTRVRLATISVMFGVLLTAVGIVYAASTTKTLSTNYTLINLGSATANVAVGYYKTDGSTWTAAASSTSFTMTANGGQAVVAQYFDGVMSSGQGSAVVSSDQPLGGVVQILARNQTPTSGAYVASSDSASLDDTVYLPLVMRRLVGASGLSTSQVIFQNAGTSSTNVTVQMIKSSASPGANFSKTFNNVAAGVSVYYDLDDESSANLADGWFGSAVVTASGGTNITVVSNLFAGVDTMQTYNGFPASKLTNDWFVPLFTSRLTNGLSTPVTVQNLTGGSIAAGAVSMTCTKNPSSTGTDFVITNTTSVVANELISFNPVSNLSIQANWYGSCRVQAPGNVAVFVQARKPGVDSTAAAYEAIPSSGTNTKMLVPLAAKRLVNGFATVINIQNLNTSSIATVNLTYTPSPNYIASGGSAAVINVNGLTIAPGGSLQRNLRLLGGSAAELTLPDGWYGTLIVDSTGSEAIDGFVELTNLIPQAGDTYMAHGVFTQP